MPFTECVTAEDQYAKIEQLLTPIAGWQPQFRAITFKRRFPTVEAFAADFDAESRVKLMRQLFDSLDATQSAARWLAEDTLTSDERAEFEAELKLDDAYDFDVVMCHKDLFSEADRAGGVPAVERLRRVRETMAARGPRSEEQELRARGVSQEVIDSRCNMGGSMHG